MSAGGDIGSGLLSEDRNGLEIFKGTFKEM